MFNNNNRGRSPRGPREQFKDEFNEKVLDVRRVTRVVKGGKRFRFRATVAIGDGKGRVGVGVGKGLDFQQSVMKGKADAKKSLIFVKLKENRTIAHEAIAKYSAAEVIIKPAKLGHGLKAGGAVRVVLGLAGIKDATAKCISRTPNKLTNALATIEALKKVCLVKPQKAEVSTN